MVVDTDCPRLLDWKENCGTMGTNAHGKVDLAHTTQKIELEKTMPLSFGIDATLEARTVAITPVGIASVNGVLRVHVPGEAPLPYA